MQAIPVSLVATAALVLATPSLAQTDWTVVEQVFQREGTVDGDVHKYSFPRADLDVTLDGVPIEPGLALSSWAAFKDMGDHAVLMGDLVLTEDEVNPAITRLAERGIAVTAIHNHLLREEPRIMYMHISGEGDPAEMARTIRLALEESGTPVAPVPETAEQAPEITFDTAAIDEIMGQQGRRRHLQVQHPARRDDHRP